MSNKYVETCLCGYSLTQKEMDSGRCPECGRNSTTLPQDWEEWEEMQIQELEEGASKEAKQGKQE